MDNPNDRDPLRRKALLTLPRERGRAIHQSHRRDVAGDRGPGARVRCPERSQYALLAWPDDGRAPGHDAAGGRRGGGARWRRFLAGLPHCDPAPGAPVRDIAEPGSLTMSVLVWPQASVNQT